MFNHQLSRFPQPVVTIHPGEYYASDQDLIICTVLGSCVSVSLYDRRLNMGGINHFMLPGSLESADMAQSQNAKYGMYAIELLYNDLLKLGARKADIVAKVFGGGSVLRLEGGSRRIPQGNTEFAFTYLEKEGIPVLASDTGGVLPRKILFFAKTGKVLLKRINGSRVASIEQEERQYLRSIQRERGSQGTAVLFDRPEDRKG